MQPPSTLIDAIDREVRAGMPNLQDRRAECQRSWMYYNRKGTQFIPRRDAESDADYRNRPKRHLPLTNRVIRVLTSKLYSPGPTRAIDGDEAATKWLNQSYADNLINSLWQRADRIAHLCGLAAFQVAATGDPATPLKLQLWCGWAEVVPYELPERANEVAACVTIDAVDERIRYTLWTDDFYQVYETDKLKPGQTAGGRISRPIIAEANPYGVLPFAFVWQELPTSGVASVVGMGEFLSDLNESIDVEMSDMAGAVRAYHTPMAIAYDCDIGLQPIKAPGRWLRVNAVPSDLSSAPTPRLEYLQAALDIEGGWANIRGCIDSELEALGIPLTAYRMDSATLPSGAALVAEQQPLTDYAVERREPFRKYESDLKTVSLKVGGNYYGDAGLLAAAERPLTLAYPPAAIELPGPDRDSSDQASLELGLESRVMIVMRRFGLNRDQAIEHLKRAVEDEAELTELRTELMPVPEPTPATDQQDQQQQGEQP